MSKASEKILSNLTIEELNLVEIEHEQKLSMHIILSNKRLHVPLLGCMVMLILSLVFNIILSALYSSVRQGHEINCNCKSILMHKNDASWSLLGDNVVYIEISKDSIEGVKQVSLATSHDSMSTPPKSLQFLYTKILETIERYTTIYNLKIIK